MKLFLKSIFSFTGLDTSTINDIRAKIAEKVSIENLPVVIKEENFTVETLNPSEISGYLLKRIKYLLI